MMEDDRKIIAEYLEKCYQKYNRRPIKDRLDEIMAEDDLREEFLEYARKNELLPPGAIADIVVYNNW